MIEDDDDHEPLRISSIDRKIELPTAEECEWSTISVLKESHALGCLQLCVERRFFRAIEEQFEKMTGLHATDYWRDSDIGGAPRLIEQGHVADYAYKEGARIMGWAAHGSRCGGFKPPFHPHIADDDEILERLANTLKHQAEKYPEAEHYAIFASSEGNPAKTVLRVKGPVKHR